MRKNEPQDHRHEDSDYIPGCKTTMALGLLLVFGLIVQNTDTIQKLMPVVKGIAKGDIDEVEDKLVQNWITEHPQEIEAWRKLTTEDLLKIQQETNDPRKHAALNGIILEVMERGAEREYLLQQKK